MPTKRPPIHGYDHLPGGPDPIPTFLSPDQYHSPAVIPILMGEKSDYDGFGWTSVVVDNTVRYGAVRTNATLRTPAIGDFLTHGVTLGPRGSVWGLMVTFKAGTDCGQIQFSLASVESPNPNRGGDAEGTLTDNSLTYIDMTAPVETYASSGAADTSFNGYVNPVFRILGVAGTPLTAFSLTTDPYTGLAEMDGGPGFYSLKARVSGKNASSSGYRAELTGLAFVRLNDLGFL